MDLRPALRDQWKLYRLYQKKKMHDWMEVTRDTIRRLIKLMREVKKE